MLWAAVKMDICISIPLIPDPGAMGFAMHVETPALKRASAQTQHAKSHPCLCRTEMHADIHVCLQDIGPQYAGVLLGMSNSAGVLAGVLGTAATGMILQNGSWDNVWNVAIALYVVGAVIWNLFSTGERVFVD